MSRSTIGVNVNVKVALDIPFVFRELSNSLMTVGTLNAKQLQNILEFLDEYENSKTIALALEIAPYKAVFAFDSVEGFRAVFLTEDYSYYCACLGKFGPPDILKVLEELDGGY